MRNDYSEHTIMHTNSNDKVQSCFHNNVSFDADNKKLHIHVDRDNEHIMILKDIERYNSIHGIKPRPHQLSKLKEKIRIEGLAENDRDFADLCSRYNIQRASHDREVKAYYEHFPNEKQQPLNNVLSGTDVTLSYGEGLLDFVYADFTPAIEQATKTSAFMDMPPDIARPENYEKIYGSLHDKIERFQCYTATMPLVKGIAYTSLYTAICPPVFPNRPEATSSLRGYINYLTALQKEYLELIEFCFDEEYYSEVFEDLRPEGRYYIYRQAKGYSDVLLRKETVKLEMRTIRGDAMPFGRSEEEALKRMFSSADFGDPINEFLDRYNMKISDLVSYLLFPRFMNVQYEFNSVADILELEFSKLMEHNIRFRKCKRCGKYFIMKGNYNTKYCDRIAPGETQTCQDLAAQENYKKKTEGDEALSIYNKYYKRYYARVKAKQIKEADFKKWKYAALTKRSECSDGKITPDEFGKWMEAYFPNRKKKT